jgi:hypothetical protein
MPPAATSRVVFRLHKCGPSAHRGAAANRGGKPSALCRVADQIVKRIGEVVRHFRNTKSRAALRLEFEPLFLGERQITSGGLFRNTCSGPRRGSSRRRNTISMRRSPASRSGKAVQTKSRRRSLSLRDKTSCTCGFLENFDDRMALADAEIARIEGLPLDSGHRPRWLDRGSP